MHFLSGALFACYLDCGMIKVLTQSFSADLLFKDYKEARSIYKKISVYSFLKSYRR